LLYVSSLGDAEHARVASLAEVFDIVYVQDPIQALARLARDDFAAVYVDGQNIDEAFGISNLLQNELILRGMPDGLALLDSHGTVLWDNGRLREWTGRDSIAGSNFFAVLGSPEALAEDYWFHAALATNSPSTSTLRSGDNCYRVHAAPLVEKHGPSQKLMVVIRDVTAKVLHEQKLAGIHGRIEFAAVTPEALLAMTVEECIGLLKSNILNCTRDVLNFNAIEIRLLDANTGKLDPLLSEGLTPEAGSRMLYARPQNNGITGFVAATGKSYLCEDTTDDPLYLTGAADAKCSLTVPLVLNDEVIGTFNVESPELRAFNESDLRLLEMLICDVTRSAAGLAVAWFWRWSRQKRQIA
jgi:GAF domain-containing protein